MVQHHVVAFRLDRNDIHRIDKQNPPICFNCDSGPTKMGLSLGWLGGDCAWNLLRDLVGGGEAGTQGDPPIESTRCSRHLDYGWIVAAVAASGKACGGR